MGGVSSIVHDSESVLVNCKDNVVQKRTNSTSDLTVMKVIIDLNQIIDIIMLNHSVFKFNITESKDDEFQGMPLDKVHVFSGAHQ